MGSVRFASLPSRCEAGESAAACRLRGGGAKAKCARRWLALRGCGRTEAAQPPGAQGAARGRGSVVWASGFANACHGESCHGPAGMTAAARRDAGHRSANGGSSCSASRSAAAVCTTRQRAWQCAQHSMSMRCTRRMNCAALSCAGGCAGGIANAARAAARARALCAAARMPQWRMRLKPGGNTCCKKRPMNSTPSMRTIFLLPVGDGQDARLFAGEVAVLR